MSLTRATKYSALSVLAAMLIAILAVAISQVHSFDVFWQLEAGKYMAQTRSFIYTDTFTLMKDVPRYEHTWLHSLILYGSWLLGGYAAISVLKGVLITMTLAVLAWTAARRGASLPAIALVLPAYILTSGGWLSRPQLWTFICFAIFVAALEHYLRHRCRHVFWLVPLALFWSNAHAGSVLAIAILAAYLVGESAQALWQKRFRCAGIGKLAILAGAVFAAGMVSPYPSRWFNTLLQAKDLGAKVDAAGKVSGSATAVFNMDWTPTTFQQDPVFFYAMGVVAAIMLLGWRRLRLADLCLLLGLSLMGLKLIRHIPFFYMGAIAICPAYLDAAVEPLKKRLPDLYRSVAALVILCLAAGLFAWDYRPLYRVYGAFNTGLREWHYPVEATEFLVEHKLPKNIYNTYDWGGYLAWQLYPDYLVFWDGRQNSPQMFQYGWNIMAGKPEWQQLLDQFKVNTIITRASTIDTGQRYPLLDRLALSPDWALVFNAESSMIFVRRGSVKDDWLHKYEKSKLKIQDTILSEALLMVSVNPNRYMAWWEMGLIYARRKQYANAVFALRQHLARAPMPNPAARKLLGQLEEALVR
jgi:hypothetical protein